MQSGRCPDKFWRAKKWGQRLARIAATAWGSALAAGLGLAGNTLAATVDVPASAVKVYADQLPDWIFSLPTELQVCEGSHQAVFGRGYWARVIDLASGRALPDTQPPGWSTQLVLTASCDLLRSNGKRWVAEGQRLPGQDARQLAAQLPQNIIARPSRDGRSMAWFVSGVYYVSRPEGRALHLLESGRPRQIDLGDPIMAAEWLPDSKSLIALVFSVPTGLSKLVRVQGSSGRVEVLAEHLDGAAMPGSIGISPDGNSVYLSLVGTQPPNNVERHDPNAQRNLHIFAFDLGHRTFTRVVASPYDDFSPTVAGDYLYWTTSDPHVQVVVLPTSGGRAQLVADGGQLPYWSADDGSLAYTVGMYRIADPAIDYDVDIVDLDAAKRPAGAARRLISGSHEDFTPMWSLDGKWLSFHSHRCKTYVPFYLDEGCTDGIYLWRAGEPVTSARLISPPGTKEVGLAEWSRDGRHIIFSSWNPKGPPNIAELSVMTIDPQSGQVLKTENLGVPPPLTSALLQRWSPTADEIAIEDIVADDRHAIWVLDYATRKVRKVLEFPCPTAFSGLAWSADGNSIFYTALTAGRQQIFAVARTGGAPRQISYEQFGDLIFPSVSRDGRWLTATRAVTTRELWRMPLRSDPTRP
jgi:Tol biopolymer transport system component